MSEYANLKLGNESLSRVVHSLDRHSAEIERELLALKDENAVLLSENKRLKEQYADEVQHLDSFKSGMRVWGDEFLGDLFDIAGKLEAAISFIESDHPDAEIDFKKYDENDRITWGVVVTYPDLSKPSRPFRLRTASQYLNWIKSTRPWFRGLV